MTELTDMDWYDDDEGNDWDESLDPDDPRRYLDLESLIGELLAAGVPGEPPPADVALSQGVTAPYFQSLLRFVDLLESGIDLEHGILPGRKDFARIDAALGPAGSRDVHGLWCDAVIARLITNQDGRSTARVTSATLGALPVSAQLQMVRKVGELRMSELVYEEAMVCRSVLHLLVRSLCASRSWQPAADSIAFGLDREYGRFADDDGRCAAAEGMSEALRSLADMALVECDGARVRLTEFGDVVLESWMMKQIA